MRWIPILLVALPSLAFSQRFTISGYVKDAATGESLIGSAILNRKTLQGTTANVHGFYSITLPADSVQMVYSYVGYTPIEVRLLLKSDTTIDMGLNNANQLEEVIVNATRAEQIQDVTQMSTVSVPIEQMKNLPALLGQVDVLKVLQLMPGVKSSEGSTGLYVRGGGPDQNLMLLDGVPVYNASHLFGFFSVFNADAINRVELIKGGFPARYGGRLSSVIDIAMKDGNMKEVHGEGSIDIIAAKFTIEAPIKKDRTSFIVSGRRTYIDVLAAPFILAANSNSSYKARAGYFFYDLNTKLNHIINKRNRIYLSTYLGDDKAYAIDKAKDPNEGYRDEYGLKWGNVITAFRWNNVVGPRLFSNLTATYSKYRFTVYNTYESQYSRGPGGQPFKEYYHSEYISGIRDWALKMDYDFVPSPAHYIRFGVGAIAHRFSPGAYTYNQEDTPADTTVGAKRIDAYEFSTYIEDDLKITDELKVNFGAHVSSFYVDDRWYYSIQPRVSARYLINKDLSIKASYASMMQYIHLLTNAGLGLPTDLWVPSTADVRPQSANQFALGAAQNFKSIYEISLEGYYKKMYNLIDYKEGTSFLNVQEDWQSKVATGGQGESYGSELLLQKKTGKVTGWIGYTLSWTNRQFDELNNGKWFPYKYDRRHDVSVAMTHAWNERMDFSMAWVYGTGNAVTLPNSTYKSTPGVANNFNFFPQFGYELYYYGDRNSFRMRSYHRLDLSFSWWKTKKWGRSKWTLAVYNVYSRRNPFFMNLTYDDDGNRKFAQYSLFPIIPSINYSFKF